MKIKRLPVLIPAAAALSLVVFFCAGPAGSQQASFKLKVTAEVANIRQSPDIGSPILHQLTQGAIIEAIQKLGDWFSVELRIDDEKVISGFVHKSLVIVIEPPVPPINEEEKPREEIQETEVVREEPLQTVPTAPVQRTDSDQRFHRFSVSFSGGLNHLRTGALNDGANGVAGYYGATLGENASGFVSPLHWSTSIGGELSYFLTKKIALALGADYISGKKKSLVAFPERKFVENVTTEPEVRSIPVSLSIIYHPYKLLRFRLGVEYHFATCRYFYRLEQEDLWREWQGQANATGLGVIGGVGFEKQITSRFGLFLEVSGRYSRIKNWEGTDTFRESSGAGSTEEGKLYIYRGEINETESFPLVFIRERQPGGAGVSDVRIASVDFSGLVIRAGIKIRF